MSDAAQSPSRCAAQACAERSTLRRTSRPTRRSRGRRSRCRGAKKPEPERRRARTPEWWRPTPRSASPPSPPHRYLSGRLVLYDIDACVPAGSVGVGRLGARCAPRWFRPETGAVAMTMLTFLTVSSELDNAVGTGVVEMPARLCRRLLREAQDLHAAGLKAFGLLVGNPAAPGHPLRPV